MTFIEARIRKLDADRRNETFEARYGLYAHEMRVAASEVLQATLMDNAAKIADLIAAARAIDGKLGPGRMPPDWESIRDLHVALEALDA